MQSAIEAIALAVLVALLLVSYAASAHEDGQMHYPVECCHQMDCAPVDKVEVVPSARYASMGFFSKAPSIMVVTPKHGTVTIPRDDPSFTPRKSEDGRMHACILQTASGPKLICFFEPPAF
jgi:hypothetical protein